MTCVNACQRNSRKYLTNGAFSGMAYCLASLGFSMPAMALEDTAASIKVGEADLTPMVRLDYISNSNAFLTEFDETETTGFIISPQLEYQANRRLFSFTLGYEGAYAGFSEDILDYNDHALTAGAVADLSTKHQLQAAFGLSKEHETTGEDLTIGLGENAGEQIEWLDTNLDVRYIYGADSARGNLVGGVVIRNIAFQNRSDLTDGRDYSLISPLLRFSYRISGDTRAFVGLRLLGYDFDNDANDRTEAVTSVGLSFAGTGKTGGEARIGVTSADFDDASQEDDTLLTVDIDMYYESSNISRFDLEYTRELDNIDAQGAGALTSDSIDDNVSLIWTYDWSGFVTTRALLGAEFRQRDCPTLGTDEISAGFEVGVRPKRWVEIGAGFTQSARSTDECTQVVDNTEILDYDRQVVSLFVRATL